MGCPDIRLTACRECGEIQTWGPYGGHSKGCPRRPAEKVTVSEWQKRGERQ